MPLPRRFLLFPIHLLPVRGYCYDGHRCCCSHLAVDEVESESSSHLVVGMLLFHLRLSFICYFLMYPCREVCVQFVAWYLLRVCSRLSSLGSRSVRGAHALAVAVQIAACSIVSQERGDSLSDQPFPILSREIARLVCQWRRIDVEPLGSNQSYLGKQEHSPAKTGVVRT